MHKIVLFILALTIHFYAGAQQQIKRCVTRELMEEKEKLQPGYLQRVDAAFQKAKLFAANKDHQRATDDTIYRVRCVFHVLYTTAAENIPDSFITNQIEVLNRDYRRLNDDTVKTRWVFKDRAADAKIEFYLADTDPNGNPTTGITHTLGNPGFLGYNAFSDNAKAASTGGKDPWPTDKYLNIWVCNISAFGVLGYAFPPDNAPNWPAGSATDSAKQGVVLDTRVVGENNTNPIDATVTKGRSAVHEIGHYLGLRHIWGDGDCTKDDGLDDTPDADAAHQQTCDTTQNTCVGTPVDDPDMIENYMDYSDDRCLNAFTHEQVGLMRAMLATSRAGVADVVILHTAIQTVDEIAAAVSIYPNPSKGLFTLQVNGWSNEKVKYTVVNTLGQTVLASAALVKNNAIDLSNQPEGLYFVKITVGSNSMVKPLQLLR